MKFEVGDIVTIKHNEHYNYEIIKVTDNGYDLISIPTGDLKPHIMLCNVEGDWLLGKENKNGTKGR